MQPRDIIFLWQRKPEFLRIVIEFLHALKFQVDEALIPSLESCIRRLALVLSIRIVLVFTWSWELLAWAHLSHNVETYSSDSKGTGGVVERVAARGFALGGVPAAALREEVS